MRQRVECLLSALDSPATGADAMTLQAALEEALANLGPEEAWLALAVLAARFPDEATVQRLVRAARLDGPLPALYEVWVDTVRPHAATWPPVEVVSDRVMVDLHHSARNVAATGIRRVSRETARRWAQQHDVLLVGWTEGYGAYRRLTPVDLNNAPTRARGFGADRSRSSGPVVVPWKCVHVMAELPVEPERSRRFQAFVMFARSTSGLIGYDCIPLTASETTDAGMWSGFAGYLAAAAHVDRIATISAAAELEFRGWRAMLSGSGQSGPDIRSIPLPLQATRPTDAAMSEMRTKLGVGSAPVVLCVGSHEPRKNHLGLLYAARVLWDEGLDFSLVFVGDLSYNSGDFDAQVESLRQANWPVRTIRGLPDDQLWAAYRLAYCTVFASLHEGFGLPVAESLMSGVPVITSNFGSMRELASQGGALLVDPRSDRSLTDALRRLLTDQSLRNRLAAEADQLPRRTWDNYATELWAYLVDGTPPGSGG